MQYISIVRYVICGIILVCICSACENKIEDIQRITTIYSDLPTLTNKNIELLYTDSGRPEIKVIAPLLNKFSEPKSIIEMPQGVKVLFYKSDKTIKSSIKAKYAIIHETTNIIEARNNVVVVNSKNEKLETEHLIWEQDAQIIKSNLFVKVTTNEEVIYGEGFESDQEFEKWEVKKPTGVISVKK